MPRDRRLALADLCYHVVNRGNRRAETFHDAEDYEIFLRLLARARHACPMRVAAYCLMPNHFHLVLWPAGDGDLGRFMHLVTTAHVRRHHMRHGTSGRIWQGRYKSFPIQQDHHLLAVLRYVERNPLHAGLVPSAERWPWSSLSLERRGGIPVESPLPRSRDWESWVNRPQTETEVEVLRQHLRRGAPFGDDRWAVETATRLGLERSLRPRGRPPRRDDGRDRVRGEKVPVPLS